MKVSDVVILLREAVYDNVEPYVYDDGQLLSFLEIAGGIYSRYRPIERKGTLFIEPGTKEYCLPDDFQTWTQGLYGYNIFNNVFDLGFNATHSFNIDFLYLANRKITEVPANDLFLLIDYCFYLIVDGAVKESSDISGLKLGKGLQIQFDNVNELNKAAQRRLQNFNDNIKLNLGGWC